MAHGQMIWVDLSWFQFKIQQQGVGIKGNDKKKKKEEKQKLQKLCNNSNEANQI